MSIATEITRIQQAKADIKSAIEAKGVTVPSSAKIDTYDDYVSQISGGGGSEDLKKMIDRTITSIVIPSDVTTIGQYAFYYCSSLTSVTIPNSVTIIGSNAFSNTNILRVNSNTNGVVNIPSGVTTISGSSSFSSCRSITSVTIPDSVTTIGSYAFYICTSLRNVTIGSGVTSIGAAAFAYTNSITSFTCNAVTPPTIGSNILTSASANLVIYVPSASVNTYKTASGWNTYADRIQAIP